MTQWPHKCIKLLMARFRKHFRSLTTWSREIARSGFMMTSSNGNIFPRYRPSVRGIHRSPVISPRKDLWRGALMFIWSAWLNGWVNNREAGDLRRHRAHYDVTVMHNFHTVVVLGMRLYGCIATCPAKMRYQNYSTEFPHLYLATWIFRETFW